MPGVSPLSPPYLTPNLRNNRSTGRRDMKTVCIPALAVTFLTLGPVPASAQTETVQEGTVLVDGRRLELPVSYLRLNENSIVRTENGRVEIGLAGGDSLFLEKTVPRGSAAIVLSTPTGSRFLLARQL
jgi:hypothetical protein